MELSTFIKNFADQFDETDLSHFSPDTIYKELAEWSSLIALSIMAMIDEEYNVRIKGSDITNALTVSGLYDIVKSRI